MSAVEISQEERDLWRFEASDECGTPSEEDERILRLLGAFEACEETRANFSELYRMANEVVPELKRRAEKAEAEVARLREQLEAARQIASSAQSVAEQAWGGEIPSPLPGHLSSSEEDMVKRFNHLNCPLCGGSGHIGDCEPSTAKEVAQMTKMVDWLAEKQIRCAANGEQWYGPTISKELHVPMYPSKNEAIDALKEAASRAVAAGEE